MSAQRKLIRNEAAAILSGQIPEIGTRVYTSRKKALFESELPCIVVFSSGEPSPKILSDGPREYLRTCNLKFEVATQGTDEDSVEDELDMLAHKLEQIFFRNDTLNSKCTGMTLGEVNIGFSVEGRQITGVCAVNFDATYPVDAPDPTEDNLPAFTSAGVEIDAGPEPDAVPEIAAEIALAQ